MLARLLQAQRALLHLFQQDGVVVMVAVELVELVVSMQIDMRVAHRNEPKAVLGKGRGHQRGAKGPFLAPGQGEDLLVGREQRLVQGLPVGGLRVQIGRA